VKIKGIIIVYHSPVPIPKIALTSGIDKTTIIKQGIERRIFTKILKIKLSHLHGLIPFFDVIFKRIPKGKPIKYATKQEIKIMAIVFKVESKINSDNSKREVLSLTTYKKLFN
jgi:hypothetical protein